MRKDVPKLLFSLLCFLPVASILFSQNETILTFSVSSRACWCDVNGVPEPGHSGILFIPHPQNYNFPEQLRIWPTGSNGGKDNVYFNFNPAQEQDWILYPGKAYTLNYRMLVYDGEISPEMMDKYRQDYAHPPQVRIEH